MFAITPGQYPTIQDVRKQLGSLQHNPLQYVKMVSDEDKQAVRNIHKEITPQIKKNYAQAIKSPRFDHLATRIKVINKGEQLNIVPIGLLALATFAGQYGTALTDGQIKTFLNSIQNLKPVMQQKPPADSILMKPVEKEQQKPPADSTLMKPVEKEQQKPKADSTLMKPVEKEQQKPKAENKPPISEAPVISSQEIKAVESVIGLDENSNRMLDALGAVLQGLEQEMLCPKTRTPLQQAMITSDGLTCEAKSIEPVIPAYRNIAIETIIGYMNETNAQLKTLKNVEHHNTDIAAAQKRHDDVQTLIGNFAHRISQTFEGPITYDVMDYPVVASDGHTYEKGAIEGWFSQNQTSPMTNQAVEGDFFLNTVLQNVQKKMTEANLEQYLP